ncbi:MAG: transposase [Nitrospirae bacterium]|nr:transposase [Nitrospirota bacterium]
MARKPRIEFDGAFYHVITRGNQRQKIFKDKEDYKRYLAILGDYKERYKYFLNAYILMSNHVHLLIETQDVPLSKILQGINQRYTIYFNRKYRTIGHLFQGRYKAILCDKDEYMLTLVKYIHLNPVRAGIIKNADEYEWSSHRCYIEKPGRGNIIIDTDQVLGVFSGREAKARRLYRAYMDEGQEIWKEEIYSTIDQRILGDERFAEKVSEKGKTEVISIKRLKEYTLGEIATGIEGAYGITLKEIKAKGKNRDIMIGRKLFSLIAKEYGYKGKEIAGYIQKDPAVVTRYLREKGDLRAEVERVIERIIANVNRQV